MTFLRYAWTWLTSAANWHGDDGIPLRILQHLGYSGLSLLIAAVIALPLGVAIGHTGKGAALIVNLTNIWRAIPTLGLLVLLVILLGFFPPPWLIPLVVLGIPPILLNSYEGVLGFDLDLTDAGRGMGMTGWQLLTKVEIPVAMPLIMLGLRTAAIFVVATATIAADVGTGGLGRYIIDGLASNNYGEVAGGAALVVVLALLVQALFTGLRRIVVPEGLRKAARTQV
jgi:osmoprotectant transport system permease protein